MDSTRTTNDQPCFGTRLCTELKRLVALVLVLGPLAIAGKYYCFDRLNEEIRAKVESQLRAHYQGLTVSVRSARRVAGQGVEIRGVRIAEAGGRLAPVLAEIDEVFAQCDTRLPDFLTRPPQITALRIERLKIRAQRKANGRWNVSNLLPLPNCGGGGAPTATITDSALEIIDGSAAVPRGSAATGMMLRNITLQVAPESRDNEVVLRIRGTVAGDHVERVEIDGTLDPASSRWELRGAVQGLEFSPRMRAALPQELSTALAPLASIRGRTFFGFSASRSEHSHWQPADAPPVRFEIHGKISEGRIDDTRLPEPLTDVEARIHCDNAGVRINELSAKCGTMQIELSGIVRGYTGRPTTDLDVTARDVVLENVPLRSLSPAMRDVWAQFQPRGLANVSGQLHFDGQKWQPKLHIDYRDLSICYQRFPYRVTDGTGTVVLAPGTASIQLRLLGGGRVLRCQAELQNPGANFSGWIQVQSEGPVAIDERVLAAMEPAQQRIVRGFRPRGSASFFARFSRRTSGEPIHRELEIKLHDCSIAHDRFPYPIDRVSGTLTARDESWLFSNLSGRNDSAEITGEGSWHGASSPTGGLSLRFVARHVPLADELHDALPETAQSLWSFVRPRGTIDRVMIDLSYQLATKHWSLGVTGEMLPRTGGNEGRSLSLEPAAFQYALNNVSGGLRYRDGEIDLVNLRATHGRASLAGEGKCVMLPGGGYRLDLSKITGDGLVLDQELRAALPGEFGRALTRYPLEGPLNAQGKVTVVAPPQNTSAPPQPSIAPQITWEADIDIENGRLNTSTPIEHICGGVYVRGQQQGEQRFARGELNVDSAMIRGVQISQLQGPYWFDGQQIVFGVFADRDTARGAPRQITARAFGGLLSIDGMLRLTDAGVFDLQATLANANLGEIARELTPHQHTPPGKVHGVVHVEGSMAGMHTWQGDGKISLRDADLYELPAMITLLKLLSIQRPNSTAFTNSNIDFRIEGDDLALDRIDFSGDAISLKGKGRMNGQGQIDLKFYPLVGREERHLAILRPLLGQTGAELMLIEVTGTIDQPEITRTPFPRLDARLQHLFPELARNESVDPKAPPAWSPRQAIQRVQPGTWR